MKLHSKSDFAAASSTSMSMAGGAAEDTICPHTFSITEWESTSSNDCWCRTACLTAKSYSWPKMKAAAKRAAFWLLGSKPQCISLNQISYLGGPTQKTPGSAKGLLARPKSKPWGNLLSSNSNNNWRQWWEILIWHKMAGWMTSFELNCDEWQAIQACPSLTLTFCWIASFVKGFPPKLSR